MGERRQITRCPDRPLCGNNRYDARAVDLLDPVDQFDANAGGASGKRNTFQRHHQTDDIRRQRLANAGCVRADEILLQQGQAVPIDPDGSQLAKACIHAVNCLALPDPPGERPHRVGNPGIGAGMNLEVGGVPVEGLQIIE